MERTDELAIPALAQLDQPVDGADHDADGGDGEGGHEALEAARAAQVGMLGVELAAAGAHAPGVLGAEDHEDGQGQDLRGQPGQHDVGAHGRVLVVLAAH